MDKHFMKRLDVLTKAYEKLVNRTNERAEQDNGIFWRYKNAVLTARHAPLLWKYDLNPDTNPYLMERFGINTVLNAGAIKLDGKYLLIARVEGWDRKSFFAVAESDNGIDMFRFRDYPIVMPQTEEENTKVYDRGVVKHEEGWFYGFFCTKRRAPNAPPADQSSAIAQ